MRASGILMPISSLPSPYGIGCFSSEAYDFVDQLVKAGQKYWQILPLGPTGYGDSPYQSFSTFAGNPYFIDLSKLVSYGWLTKEEIEAVDFGSDPQFIDYGKLYEGRYYLLRKAYEASNIAADEEFVCFKKEQDWLADYTLFMAVKGEYGGASWDHWDALPRARDETVLAKKREELKKEMEFYAFMQFEFYREWTALKQYANASGVRIIGDIPIYVSFDSSDAWANQELFQFNENGFPDAIAGVPADGFSATGQIWGNPLYRWDYHKETGYKWWLKRLAMCFELYDVVRIDHFRGFDEYFSVPYGEDSALRGHWEKGPGMDLFRAVEEAFPGKEIIAEDLGYVTDTVRQLLCDTGYPGMKILEFAFDSRDSGCAADYFPHNYVRNCVVYTGTHDNETVIQWFNEGLQPEEKIMVRNYICDHATPDEEIHWPMICTAMRSVAKLCVIPMQDYLALGKEARINRPSTSGGNWKWRLLPGQFSDELIGRIRVITAAYGR